MTADPVDVLSAADPVAAVLSASAEGRCISLTTSGTTARPRSVVRTAASWVDSFPAVSLLTGIGPGARVWVPGPLSASMNLFAAAHARAAGAAVGTTPTGATHGCLTPAALVRALDDGVDVSGMHLVVAGDRLRRALARRATEGGACVSHYYGAAELSFVAWGSDEEDLRAFPGVELRIRDGLIWVRSPYVSRGYLVPGGPFTTTPDGFATVGDRGRLTRGVLTVAGRGGEAVVTGGATVVVDDVEQELSRVSGAEVVVVGVPHARLGQLVAAVFTDAAALTAARAAAPAELTPAQRPRLWFHLPAWPVTTAGKVDRSAIADLVASGGVAPAPRPAPRVGA
jgi:acyl-CoA synthetase (AMP-forming)/AMP-acid ligase II